MRHKILVIYVIYPIEYIRIFSFNEGMAVKSQRDTAYEVQWRRKKESKWYPALFLVYLGFALTYLIWRTTIINWHVWYGCLVYAAELYGIVTTSLFLFVTQKVYLPVAHKPKRKPIVDVLIPTYSEPVSVLEPVVIGAKKIRGRRNILVLDDGNRPEIKAMAKRLKVLYFPRTTNLHAKAGNLNNGLQHTDAELLITLDADHIPIRSFIEETAGFFEDPMVAFVQSPQTFYNTSSFLFRKRFKKHDWSEQIMFYDCIQPAKNNWNAAFFVGTSAMLRRKALDSVGGFATGTATEDIHTSLKLHAKGWVSVFLPKPLAYGLEAESLKEFYKQRKRWAAGSLGLLFRSEDSPLRAKGLTISQRLNYISACLAHLQGVQKVCFFLAPLLTIVTARSPITGNVFAYSIFFLLYCSVALSATWLYSRSTYHFIYTEAYSLASMLAHFGGIMGVIKVQKKFAVSIKTANRKGRTWLHVPLWTLYVAGLIGLTRAIGLIFIARQHSALLVYSTMFLLLNSTFLLAFLLPLRIYETKVPQDPVYKNLKPTAMYNFIVKSAEAPDPIETSDSTTKKLTREVPLTETY